MMATPAEPLPDFCLLEHPVFSTFGAVLFRRATTDGVPVMVVPMGAKEAMLPLRGLRREFAIADASSDGRMLGLIADSLEFVAGLQVGDRLPAEVLTGAASWEPSQQCRDLAKARLRLQLVALVDPDGNPGRQEQTAFASAARALGLEAAADVVRLVDGLAEELAYIETLRGKLLHRMQGLAERVAPLGRALRGDRNRTDMLAAVQRLMANAGKLVGSRFDEVDAQTGDILSALRDAAARQAFIRSKRDWLYRCQRAWEPVLRQWDNAGGMDDEGVWQLVGKTYQFLAPRYMPVSEWEVFNSGRRGRAVQPTAKVMKW